MSVKNQNGQLKKFWPKTTICFVCFFADGSEKLFDFKPYLKKRPYEPLKDFGKFSKARVAGDSVIWDDGIDIAPEELYEKSIEA